MILIQNKIYKIAQKKEIETQKQIISYNNKKIIKENHNHLLKLNRWHYNHNYQRKKKSKISKENKKNQQNK